MTAKQCQKCGGSGGGDEPHLYCPECGGDGYLVTPFTTDSSICPECNGTGERTKRTTALQDALRYATDKLEVQHRLISNKRKEKKEDEINACPHPKELDGTPGACPAWYRGNERGYQKGLEEGKQPWVKIGSGDYPDRGVIIHLCYLDPDGNKHVGKAELSSNGKFYDPEDLEAWYSQPTHYQLIPDPGTPPDEALEGLEDLDFKELEPGTPEDE